MESISVDSSALTERDALGMPIPPLPPHPSQDAMTTRRTRPVSLPAGPSSANPRAKPRVLGSVEGHPSTAQSAGPFRRACLLVSRHAAFPLVWRCHSRSFLLQPRTQAWAPLGAGRDITDARPGKPALSPVLPQPARHPQDEKLTTDENPRGYAYPRPAAKPRMSPRLSTPCQASRGTRHKRGFH